MKDFFMRLTPKQKIILGVVIILIMIMIFIVAYKYFYTDNDYASTVVSETVSNDNNELNLTEDDTNSDDGILKSKNKKNSIIVHVIGEVNKPGVVKLDEGARIIDAINAAGGQTENADLSKVNLAYVVEDGTQIYIPHYNENLTDTALIRDNAGDNIIQESVIKGESSGNNTKVNINNATKEKLITLPGIGEAMADKIIEYRNQNGKFDSIDDIKKVNGIGESKFNNIKDKITVK